MQAEREFRTLNERFRSERLLSASFYEQIRGKGIEPHESVLVRLTPDGANTYFGQVIRQDGTVFDFDIDLDLPAHSKWVETTAEFENSYRRFAHSKPWREEVLAQQLRDELRAGRHDL